MSLHPQLLQGGFWLYVWRIEPRYVSEAGHGPYLLYVGRTGDSSSANAAPPYRRLGQHLGHHPASNALRRHLVARNLVPEKCEHFDFFAYGPLFPAQLDMKAHLAPRDVVAALECKLAAALQDGGYDVMNEVRSLKPLDQILWQRVREAFREKFPRICD
jgi:hypothetical protein